MNEGLSDALDGSYCKERIDMVEELVDLSTGDGVDCNMVHRCKIMWGKLLVIKSTLAENI